MDYEKIIHTFVDPFVKNKDAIMVREMPSESEKDVTLLIVAENEDVAKMIGKRGVIANALREVISIGGKTEGKHIHLKFESFDDEKEEEKESEK